MTDTAATANGATTTTSNGNSKNEDFGPNVHVSSHPVLSHKITILRSSTTLPGQFRAVMREVTYHLGYEATSSLTTNPVAISVPVPKNRQEHLEYQGHKLVERVAMIPILRSGLGMVDSMLELLPNSEIHHIGMYRVLGQNPVQYFNRLPKTCDVQVAYVLDPCIATASTLISLVKILEKWGVPEIHVICVIASASGLKNLVEAHPKIKVTIGTVDEQVSDSGQILPGLGDSGDRLFGTGEVDEESLLHPSKRKRANSQG